MSLQLAEALNSAYLSPKGPAALLDRFGPTLTRIPVPLTTYMARIVVWVTQRAHDQHDAQDVTEDQALLDAGRETVLVNGKPCDGEKGQVRAAVVVWFGIGERERRWHLLLLHYLYAPGVVAVPC